MRKLWTPLVLGSLLLAVVLYQNCAPKPLEPNPQSKKSTEATNTPPSTEANPVIGYIDGYVQENSVTMLKGWACAKGLGTPIEVRLYRGGPETIGDSVGFYKADQPSEPAVANQCASNGTAHRFSIPIPESLKTLYAGQLIYVHGISPTASGKNALLAHSGEFTIPAVGSSTSLDVNRVPIYRFLKPSGAYLFTLLHAEGANPALKFVYQGTIDLFKGDRNGERAPVYRCLIVNTDRHFMSHQPNCEGQTPQGLLGYVEKTQQAWATRPLYRCWKATGHLITVNAAECQNNQFTIEFALGYIP